MNTTTIKASDIRTGTQVVERGGALLTVTRVELVGKASVRLHFARYGSTAIDPTVIRRNATVNVMA